MRGQSLTCKIGLGGDEELGAEVLEWILGGEVLGVLPAVEGKRLGICCGLAGYGGIGIGHFVGGWWMSVWWHGAGVRLHWW